MLLVMRRSSDQEQTEDVGHEGLGGRDLSSPRDVARSGIDRLRVRSRRKSVGEQRSGARPRPAEAKAGDRQYGYFDRGTSSLHTTTAATLRQK